MKRKSIYAAAGLVLFFLAACNMAGPDIRLAGTVPVQIGIGIEGRTVRPGQGPDDDLINNYVKTWQLWGKKTEDTGDLKWLLSFSQKANDESNRTVYLEPEIWDFTLKGLNAQEDLVLEGKIKIREITLAGPNSLNFTVAPVSENGKGRFKITIELPEGHGITMAYFLLGGTVRASSVPPANPNLGGLYEVIFNSTSNIISDNEPLLGDYYFSVRLVKKDSNNAEVLYGVVSEMIHVRANLPSEKTYTLSLSDLNQTYLIDYVENGGDILDGDKREGHYQVTDAEYFLLTSADIARQGYTFAGWYRALDLSGTPVTSIPQGSTKNEIFYAKWEMETYTITYVLNGGTNPSDPAPKASYDITDVTNAVIPLPTKLTKGGHEFAGWYADATLTNGPVTEIPANSTGHKTFYAKWKDASATVSYALEATDDPTLHANASVTMAQGGHIDFSVKPPDGSPNPFQYNWYWNGVKFLLSLGPYTGLIKGITLYSGTVDEYPGTAWDTTGVPGLYRRPSSVQNVYEVLVEKPGVYELSVVTNTQRADKTTETLSARVMVTVNAKNAP
ncbi:MAG: InlB B-repeat-containing protein [Treponema sp.]|jgi:uncharacterized repeat protein (TIGR02543 family)|nr:InlB B-repeat-containing protein [Treponema sp.]